MPDFLQEKWKILLLENSNFVIVQSMMFLRDVKFLLQLKMGFLGYVNVNIMER